MIGDLVKGALDGEDKVADVARMDGTIEASI